MPLQYDRGVRVLIFPPLDPASTSPLVPLLYNPVPPISGVPSIPQLSIEFTFSLSISPAPNPWTVTMRNVSPTSRNIIAGKVTSLRSWKPVAPVAVVDGVLKPGGQVVTTTLAGMAHLRLDAGFSGALGPVLSGAAESVRGHPEGETHVLELTGSDGGFNEHAAVPFKVFPGGTPASAILAYLALTLGGAVLAPTAGFASLGGAVLPGGASLQGSASKGLTDLCDVFGFSWWMEEDISGSLMIYILAPGEVIPAQPLVVSPAPIPGAIRLHRSPEPVEGGGLQISCELAPKLRLARPVILASAEQQGPYRIESVDHHGHNREGPWTTTAVIKNPFLELGL